MARRKKKTKRVKEDFTKKEQAQLQKIFRTRPDKRQEYYDVLEREIAATLNAVNDSNGLIGNDRVEEFILKQSKNIREGIEFAVELMASDDINIEVKERTTRFDLLDLKR